MSDSAGPSVSVVIPAREREPYLSEAVASAIAEQPLEILVVTPAGAESARIAERLGAVVLDSTQVGTAPQPKRNLGARMAGGGAVAFLDADDLFPKGRTAAMRAALVDAVSGSVRTFISPDSAAELNGRVRVDPEPRPGQVAGALLVRRDAFLELGGFREDLAAGEVADFRARAERAELRLATIDGVVLERRLHSGEHLAARHGLALHESYLRIARERILRSRRP